MLNNLKPLLLLAGIILMSACTPIDDFEEHLEGVEKNIAQKTYLKKIDDTEKAIVDLSSSPAYQGLLNDDVLTAEKLEVTKVANDIHARAKQLRSMEELDDNPRTQKQALDVFGKLTYAISTLNTDLRKWKNNYERVVDIVERRDQEREIVEKAATAFFDARESALTAMAKAKLDHPHQTARINEFASHLNDFKSKYETLVTFVRGETNNPQIEDYLNYVSLYESVNVNDNFPVTLASDYERMLEQLYTSYSKVLLESEEYHGVSLAAVSWDNYYDNPTEHNRAFPYTEVTYLELSQIKSKLGSGRTYWVSSIESDGLISKATQGKSQSGWDSGDDEAEIWIEDAESEYTHLYLVIENGVATEVEESVDRNTLLRLANAEGQEVLSKPYGKFEDEAIDKPQTPGMAYVGKPQYGQWERDPITGADVWVWFAAYSIMDDIIDDRIDRRRHKEYLAGMGNYTAPRYRNNYHGTNRYGVTSNQSPIQQSLTRSRNNNLKGSGQSFRNRGPSKGK